MRRSSLNQFEVSARYSRTGDDASPKQSAGKPATSSAGTTCPVASVRQRLRSRSTSRCAPDLLVIHFLIDEVNDSGDYKGIRMLFAELIDSRKYRRKIERRVCLVGRPDRIEVVSRNDAREPKAQGGLKRRIRPSSGCGIDRTAHASRSVHSNVLRTRGGREEYRSNKAGGPIWREGLRPIFSH